MDALTGRPWLAPALLALLAGAAILIALASQHWGGLQPCLLCHYQRWAHGGVAASGLIGAVAGASRRPRAAGLLTMLAALAALAGAGIALYHVGVEQQWWPGTAGCTGAPLEPGGDLDALRQQLEEAPIVRCSDVAWSLFGISMAGYNALFSAALAAFAALAARQLLREGR